MAEVGPPEKSLGKLSTGDGEPSNKDENEVQSEKDSDRLYPDYESQRGSGSAIVAIKNREKWSNKVEFLMASLSTSVGLGNIWRFPFVAKENGGGAFLIPYMTVLIFLAKPLYFVELTAGQFCSRGALGMWDMAPAFKGMQISHFCNLPGIALAIIAISVITVSFYAVILSWGMLYLAYSFQSELPWSKCLLADYKNSVPSSIFTQNMSCVQNNATKRESVYIGYQLADGTMTNVTIPTAAAFFRFIALKSSDHVNDGLGLPDWRLVICLMIIWTFIFLNLMFGVKSFGKGSYFTALFPYSMLFILLVKTLTEEGAGEGILHFFTPNFSKIIEVQVWFQAATQAFFSLGVGYGVITSYGSYNPFRQIPWGETAIVTIADMLTSILAGVIAFGTIGTIKHQTKAKSIDEVTAAGPGLTFVTYPQALSHFNVTVLPQLFSFLFFFMLLTLGIGSGSGFVQVTMGAIQDSFPILTSRKLYKTGSVAVCCFILFLSGIIYTTPGGGFMIDFFNNYCSEWVVFIVVVFEAIGLSWVYGFKAFVLDMKFMFDVKNVNCGRVCSVMKYWGYLIPVVLIAMLGLQFWNIKPTMLKVFDREFDVPNWERPLGWILWACIVALVPGTAIYVFFTRKSHKCKHKLLATFRPNNKWGPKDSTEKWNWIQYRRAYNPTNFLYRISFGTALGAHKTPWYSPRSSTAPSEAESENRFEAEPVVSVELHEPGAGDPTKKINSAMPSLMSNASVQ